MAKESLDRIGHESEVLNVMIGDLLSLSRLEAEMEHMDFEKADLGSILESVVEDANFEARPMKREVKLDYPDDLGPLKLYSELVRGAVENIVRNGLRYAPEGTSVTVMAQHLDRDGRPGVSISVLDRGPGVPEAELGRSSSPSTGPRPPGPVTRAVPALASPSPGGRPSPTGAISRPCCPRGAVSWWRCGFRCIRRIGEDRRPFSNDLFSVYNRKR